MTYTKEMPKAELILKARNDAFEEAAAVCSKHAQNQSMFHQHAEMYCADFLANSIIKLISPSTIKEDEQLIDRAWNKFNAAISDGPDSPYPGMATAFEKYYSQKWADPDWRKETSVWAAAWKEAISSKELS